jgi:ergothioneine biosynthesis protein EgtB
MTPATETPESILIDEEFCRVRQQSEALCEPLSPEDMMVQSCEEASPAKWHLAHTTWFFETFILSEYLPGYREFDPNYRWLFNSYYNAVSDQPEKKLRSSFSRPGIGDVFRYRRHVEEKIRRLLGSKIEPETLQQITRRITLGLNHEQQHQELLATDIKHALWSNPLRPVYRERAAQNVSWGTVEPARWLEYKGGLREIGFSGPGFAFDMESPRHTVYLQPFRLASRPVSCLEYLEFIEDAGYRRPELWLAAGWDTVKAQQWEAPLYWRRSEGNWQIYTLSGERSLNELGTSPVCHVSYFEADAFAHWAGKRLPTEAEWEVAAQEVPVKGNMLETGQLHSAASEEASAGRPLQMFGDVWEWTQSAFLGYPGYRPTPGALGEYNGKFMSGQMVLRGGSAVTPASHIRPTYRNFFAPQTRWQFSGIRLAE